MCGKIANRVPKNRVGRRRSDGQGSADQGSEWLKEAIIGRRDNRAVKGTVRRHGISPAIRGALHLPVRLGNGFDLLVRSGQGRQMRGLRLHP
ncbi:hypothetical protein OIU25_32510 [Rhizobium sp. BT-175]|nr:hypothetical protein [Rhizobium sp. BT-175]MCV9947588.1 hypothetical protein [Rhizobium sp. BT-175]